MGERLYRTREVAELLNLSVSGVKKWIKEGKIRAIRVGRFWMIPESEVRRLLFGVKPSEIRAVIYARVSSHKQKKDGNLNRQIERLRSYCSAKGYKVVDVITDVASGLKEDRSGLLKLFDIVEKRQIDVVVVEFKDRLTRFGFEYLKRYFKSHGVKIEVIEETEKGYKEELVEDFVSIVISFAGRIYGKRSQKFRKIKKVIEEVTSDDD
ncbi:MAG: IS607 family transposase [Thermoprotei archaeon]|nr:MAG: IS607 family transposase [Thermoprotei archaeon]